MVRWRRKEEGAASDYSFICEVTLTSVRLPTAGGPRSTTFETEQHEEHVKDHDHQVEAGSTTATIDDLHLPPLGFLSSSLIR